MILEKGSFQNKVSTCVLSNTFSLNNMSDYFRQNYVLSESFNSMKSWGIFSSLDLRIKTKIEEVGVPLGKWNLQINRGILTGFNEAFIINSEMKAELIKKSSKNVEIIRPILLGRNIKRYSFEWEGLWLITTHNGIKSKNISRIDVENDYPVIFDYLKQFRSQLEKRLDKGDHWTNLRSCSYLEDFSEPKIVWGNLALRSQFCYIPNDFIINAPSPFFVTENLYLLAILNSKLGNYYIKQLGVIRSGGYLEYKPMFIEKLPIPIMSKREQIPFIEIIKEIILKKGNGENTNKLEDKIDEMTFKLYQLTKDEISTINSQILL
jgi:hypothetical protein